MNKTEKRNDKDLKGRYGCASFLMGHACQSAAAICYCLHLHASTMSMLDRGAAAKEGGKTIHLLNELIKSLDNTVAAGGEALGFEAVSNFCRNVYHVQPSPAVESALAFFGQLFEGYFERFGEPIEEESLIAFSKAQWRVNRIALGDYAEMFKNLMGFFWERRALREEYETPAALFEQLATGVSPTKKLRRQIHTAMNADETFMQAMKDNDGDKLARIKEWVEKMMSGDSPEA